MKTLSYYVSMDDEKWMHRTVDDFRYICTSGLFKQCDKIYIAISSSLGEEWVRFFWGRIDDEHKVEIYLNKKGEN